MHTAEDVREGRIGELYRLHAPDGLRLAYLLTGDRGVAEDVVHDAFLRVIGRLVHLRKPGAFDAYLRRAVVNAARSHHRRVRTEQRFLSGAGPLLQGESIEPDVVGRDAMRRALLGLPERQRAALVLRFYEDLSESEIADVLRCRPGTVRSLISRGMQGLRTRLGRESHAT